MLRLLIFTTFVLFGHCSEAWLEKNERVVGGYEAKEHAWPSQISLQYYSGGSWYHTCGGTLVRPNWVMTAAHCVDSNMSFRVVVGDHNIYQQEGTEQYISVSSIHIHPNWNSNNVAGGYDIAMLRLSQSATLNSYVQLGALPPSGQILPNNNPCYITGWGRTKSNGKVLAGKAKRNTTWLLLTVVKLTLTWQCYGGGNSMNDRLPGQPIVNNPVPVLQAQNSNGQLATVLQEAYLPVVAYATCSSSSYWGSTVKNTMVCAGGDGTRSGCQGDSGGPLHCLVNGAYYVHGVTSFVSSAGCNVYRKPTVFTRVSAYISWINSIIY